MAYALTEKLDRIVREKLASGQYASEEDILLAALRLLDDEEETIAMVAEGYQDVQAGRHRPFDEANREFRQKHNIPQDA